MDRWPSGSCDESSRAHACSWMGGASFGVAGQNLQAHWIVLPSSGVLLHACSPLPSGSPGQEEPKPPASHHYPSLDVVGHGGSSVIPRRCISLLVFVCSSAHSELQLCLGLATAACNCSSSQTSVSLPQGWGWGCLGNAVGVVCLVVCSRNVGQTVKFFSPLVK